jgi:exopolyphosphatase/guanosine-5'-triphosphate,3'-diphosphate pyrophosphatase
VREIKEVGFDFVIGSSGTVLNMVEAIVQSETPRGVDATNGFEAFSQTVSLDQLRRMNRRLARMTARERSRVPGLEKGRADIIIAGGLLLETILSALGASEITSCDWSLREGVILDYLRKATGAHKARAAVERGGAVGESALTNSADHYPLDDVRSRSVLSVARRYDYDAPHSHLVASLALQIFDGTYDLHGMGESERKLLYFAALLHDIGYHIAHNNHHRHGLYLIKNSEMPGFTASEIAIMGTAVRYHRGSMPKKSGDARLRREHEDFYALERDQRATVLRLSAMLQLADGLDRTHNQSVKEIRCEVSGAEVTFFVEGKSGSDLEIWSAERKAKMFEEIFRVEVRFEPAAPKPAYREPGAAAVS